MSDESNKVGPTGMIVIGIIFVIVGIGVIFLGMNEVQTSRKKAASRDWPKINGVVVRSDVRQLRDTDIPNIWEVGMLLQRGSSHHCHYQQVGESWKARQGNGVGKAFSKKGRR